MQDQQNGHTLVLLTIGKRIAEKRKLKGLSQRKLALECGWDKTNLQRMENGKANPTTKTLLIICSALNITVSELFEGVESKIDLLALKKEEK